MHIVEVDTRKSLDLAVLCPVRDITAVPMEVANARMYDLLSGLIDDHRTTLIFTNTRSGTEHVSFRLKERGVEDLEAHHGSLSKVTRLDVEQKLKEGKLKAAVSSTSLELGIDIGYIDLVVQIGSPKSVAKGLQRIGRAGHAYGETATGRMIAFEPWDLMECATLAKAAYDNRIDRVEIPHNPLDVLAQALVAMSLEKRWGVDEAFELARRSYAFHDLTKKDFLAVLDYLSSRNPDIKVFAKIWLDEEEARFGKKKGTRMIYYTNVGTIPEEGTYHVFSERGSPLGELSEKFVEYLSPSDVFVLGGRTYQFVRVRGTSVYVKDASGHKPTVPSWTGEMLPRSFDLSIAVGEFRRDLAAKIAKDGEAAAKEWLQQEYRTDTGSAQSLVSYVQEQVALIPELPTDRRVLLEGYIDVKGNRNVIFHYPFGRRVNDALSRAIAFAVTETHRTNVRVSVTDDNFMITVAESDFASLPSPFAHNVVLQGVSDLVLMEDRSALLRELHRKVLERVMPSDQSSSIQFQPGEIVEYFRRKLPKVARKEDILSYLDRVGDANLLQEKGRNVFDVATASFSEVRKWSGQLMDEGLIESVWTPQGIHWALKDHVPNYVSVYAQRSRLKPPEEKVLALLKEKPVTHKELLRKTKRPKDALNESLRRLERSYLVARRGVEETIYVAREPVRGPFEEALDKVLTKRLDADGPYGATELAVALGLEAELVEEVLRDLESEGVVSSGHFLVDKEFQFMLTRDLQRLQRKGETREVFDETQVKAFLLEKQFRKKEALDKLDYDVYVIRKFQGDGWTARNLYTAFDAPAKEVKDAVESLVKRFLASYGPVPFSGIREWARFEWDELERLVDRLEEQGLVTRILVTGKAEGEMCVLAEDLPALRKASGKAVSDPVRVLSLLDPWTQPLWAQVASRYGEGWFFPLVKDGDLVGMAEVWEMSGCIEVRELDLASPDLLKEAIDGLVRMMAFYALRGVEGFGVTRFQGTEDALGLCKAAKGKRLTKDMKTVLKLIEEEGPISRQRLLVLSDLSRPSTATALKNLYEGLHVTRDADNRYRLVPDLKIGREEARREVLRRIIRSVGVTSAESLAACTRFEYNMGETRQRLRELERERWLTKRFLARVERTVTWILKDDIDRIGQLGFRRKFVLTPMDNLFLYLREAIVAKFHMGYCYVVFDGPEMVAAFKARRRKWQVMVTAFQGDPAARRNVAL